MTVMFTLLLVETSRLGSCDCIMYVICCSVLLRSSEAPEDDYKQGIEDLKEVLLKLFLY